MAIVATAGTGSASAQTGAVQAAPAPAAPATEWLKTSGSTITTTSGQPFQIKAVNWFGLETSNCSPHGLWTISMKQAMDQMAAFGFNTIRLPFANQCLDAGATTNSINFAQNPTLQGKTPLQVMDTVIAEAKTRGMRVILDRHRPDFNSQSELWYTSAYSEQRWIADWKMLAQRYLNDPTVIGADLHNEPHGRACWGCADTTRNWAAAATRAGNAIQTVNPKWLIIVEGVEAQGNGSYTWWGGGLSDARATPITLTVPNQIVYSAHDYPASIYAQSWFGAANYPANLPGVWDRNWGYLQKENIAPVLLGEFGTKLQTDSDRKWLAEIVKYLKAGGFSFAFWSFNPNSGDTGGLVGDDWVTPQQAKLDALAPLLGAGSVPTTPPTTTPPTTTPPTTTPPTTTPPTTTPPTTTPPTTTPPTTTPPTTTPPTTTPPVNTGAVSATWILQSAWNAGYVANFVVKPTSAKVTGWTVSWADPGAISIVNAWGMNCKVGGGRITCTGADWAAVVNPGSSVQVGLQVNGNGTAPSTPVITIG